MIEKPHPVTISPKAVVEIRGIMKTKGIPDGYGLRVGVKGGGCSGMSFLLGFDQQKENDVAYQIEDIPVFVEKKHTMYILGMEIDFYEGAEARGFTFVNPEAENKG